METHQFILYSAAETLATTSCPYRMMLHRSWHHRAAMPQAGVYLKVLLILKHPSETGLNFFPENFSKWINWTCKQKGIADGSACVMHAHWENGCKHYKSIKKVMLVLDESNIASRAWAPASQPDSITKGISQKNYFLKQHGKTHN